MLTMGIRHRVGIGDQLHRVFTPCPAVIDGAAFDNGTCAWSILHVSLFANASETFFFNKMSSSSGEERSGRKGTKMGRDAPGPDFDVRLFEVDEGSFGLGACI